MSEGIKYSIDRVVIRNSRIFGFGWVFHPDELVNSLRIELRTAAGNTINLPVVYCKQREDVSAQ